MPQKPGFNRDEPTTWGPGVGGVGKGPGDWMNSSDSNGSFHVIERLTVHSIFMQLRSSDPK